MSDRLVRFPGTSWDEIEGLTEPPQRTIQHAIFHLLDEPVPPMATPFPPGGPLPGAYELAVPADSVKIWYTLNEHNGREVINVVICSGTGVGDSAM